MLHARIYTAINTLIKFKINFFFFSVFNVRHSGMFSINLEWVIFKFLMALLFGDLLLRSLS